MILLDTNMVSEPLRKAPESRVIEWMNVQLLETLYLSAVTVAELRAGVAVLPRGRRQAGLRDNVEKQILPLFAGRVLPFDLSCTPVYADLMAKARAVGAAITAADGYIAAIAIANEFSVATRDTRPFRAVGVATINPWDYVQP